MLDFDAINSAALGRYPDLLHGWFPAGKLHGNEFLVGDLTGRKGESLSINVKTGAWADFAGDGKGGDPVSLYAAMRTNGDQLEAARQLGLMTGAAKIDVIPERKRRSVFNDEPEMEQVPDGAPPHPTMFKGVTFSQKWEYRDRYGNLMGCVLRFNMAEGKKETVPLRWSKGRWVFKSAIKPRSLYRLQELYVRPDAPVAIGEGEKTADALQKLMPRYVAVTWPGGTKAVDLADWSHLAGRSVIIFPDADEVGITAAERIAQLLTGVAKEIKLVTPQGEKDGWDAADALADGWTPKQFAEWAKSRVQTLGAVLSEPTTDAPEPELTPVQRGPDELKIGRIGNDSIIENPYFRPLGVAQSSFWFYLYQTGQVMEFTGPGLERKGNLYTLAPAQFWLECCEGKPVIAMENIIRVCEIVGMFDPTKIRGVGAWEDAGRSVLHLGDRLIVDGEPTSLRGFQTRFVYEQRRQLEISSKAEPLRKTEAYKLVEICDNLRWVDAMSGKLLAGWMFASIICGAVGWRSHIYIIGPAGSGKSWMMDHVISRVLDGVALKVQSKSTEAGIRQALGADARPVIFDEAEAEDQAAQMRMQGVFDLARQASSGGAPIVKGSSGNNSNWFTVRSAFCFASINPSVSHYADETRVTMLRLRPPANPRSDAGDAEAKMFSHIQDMVLNVLTDDYKARLLARAVKLMSIVKHNQKVFAMVGNKYFGGQRQADQMSMMLAGLYALHADDKISLQFAEDWLKKQNWGEITEEEVQTTEERLLSSISQHQMQVHGTSIRTVMTVGEMIYAVANPSLGEIDPNPNFVNTLRRHGLKYDHQKKQVLISNTADGMKEILRHTPWSNKWNKVLMNVPGAEIYNIAQRFAPGISTCAVGVPLGSLT